MDRVVHPAPLCAEDMQQWIRYFTVISDGYVVNGRHDSDDCVQECCLELLGLLDEMDPTDPGFQEVLKTRVFRRLIDMQRFVLRRCRDVRLESALSAEVRETCTDPSPGVNPEDMVIVRELESIIESRLAPGPQTVLWRELVSPSSRLGRCFTQYRLRVGRELREMPAAVYAAATGLSERQCRHALKRIRAVTKSVLFTEGPEDAGFVSECRTENRDR